VEPTQTRIPNRRANDYVKIATELSSTAVLLWSFVNLVTILLHFTEKVLNSVQCHI
jgi:hypothetical protein